jgi:hypothetical protein
METIIQFFDWFWKLNLDSLLVPWAKANAIPLGAVYAVLRWWVKRTPSTEDDELLDRLKSVIPILKNR